MSLSKLQQGLHCLLAPTLDKVKVGAGKFLFFCLFCLVAEASSFLRCQSLICHFILGWGGGGGTSLACIVPVHIVD